MSILFAVAFGGAVGAVGRHGMTILMARVLGTAYPWGTLAVNLAGSLMIGVCWYLVEEAHMGPEARYFLMTGLLGSLTTFSAFSLEVTLMLRNHQLFLAGAYIVISVTAGVMFAFAGYGVIRYMLR